jgi:hypothetical protein
MLSLENTTTALALKMLGQMNSEEKYNFLFSCCSELKQDILENCEDPEVHEFLDMIYEIGG